MLRRKPLGDAGHVAPAPVCNVDRQRQRIIDFSPVGELQAGMAPVEENQISDGAMAPLVDDAGGSLRVRTADPEFDRKVIFANVYAGRGGRDLNVLIRAIKTEGGADQARHAL